MRFRSYLRWDGFLAILVGASLFAFGLVNGHQGLTDAATSGLILIAGTGIFMHVRHHMPFRQPRSARPRRPPARSRPARRPPSSRSTRPATGSSIAWHDDRCAVSSPSCRRRPTPVTRLTILPDRHLAR
jgi:hypothetical protein